MHLCRLKSDCESGIDGSWEEFKFPLQCRVFGESGGRKDKDEGGRGDNHALAAVEAASCC